MPSDVPVVEGRFRPNFSDILIYPIVDPEDNFNFQLDVDDTSAHWQPGIEILARPEEELFNPETNDTDNELLLDFLSFMAKRYKEKVIEAVEDQEFENDWEPLNSDYSEWKKSHGLDERILISSGQMLDAIRVRYHPQLKMYSVGIDKNEKYRKVETIKDSNGNPTGWELGQKTDVKILDVARWHEFGTENMAERRVWRPIRTRMAKNVQSHFEDWKMNSDEAQDRIREVREIRETA